MQAGAKVPDGLLQHNPAQGRRALGEGLSWLIPQAEARKAHLLLSPLSFKSQVKKKLFKQAFNIASS